MKNSFVIYSRFNILKCTAKAPTVDFLRLNTLRCTKSAFFNPKSYDEPAPPPPPTCLLHGIPLSGSKVYYSLFSCTRVSIKQSASTDSQRKVSQDFIAGDNNLFPSNFSRNAHGSRSRVRNQASPNTLHHGVLLTLHCMYDCFLAPVLDGPNGCW